MISAEQEATILRLYHAEKWPVGTIARQLGLHHATVRRALTRSGIVQPVRRRRPSKLDDYLPFLTRTLEQYPELTASRLYEMARQRGYQGSPHHFRHWVAPYRPRPAAEAYLRVTKEKTAPEELVRMMADPEILITLKPMGAEKIAAFLHRIGALKDTPASWRDLYFPNVAEGS